MPKKTARPHCSRLTLSTPGFSQHRMPMLSQFPDGLLRFMAFCGVTRRLDGLARYEILKAYQDTKMTASDIDKLMVLLKSKHPQRLGASKSRYLSFIISFVRSWLQLKAPSFEKSDHIIALFFLDLIETTPNILEDSSLASRVRAAFTIMKRLSKGSKITMANHDFSDSIKNAMSLMQCHFSNVIWLFAPQLLAGCGCETFINNHYVIAVSSLLADKSLESDMPVNLFHELLHAMSHYVRTRSRYLNIMIHSLYVMCDHLADVLDDKERGSLSRLPYWSSILVYYYKDHRQEEIMIRILEKLHFYPLNFISRLKQLPIDQQDCIDILIRCAKHFKQLVMYGYQRLSSDHAKADSLGVRSDSPVSVAQVNDECFPMTSFGVAGADDAYSPEQVECGISAYSCRL